MKIDAEKLAKLIERFASETNGFCSSTGACIGVIDGKQIQLFVKSKNGDDQMQVREKFVCVE